MILFLKRFEVMKNPKWYFIELSKFRKANANMEDKLNQWLAFIDDYDRGKIKMAENKNKTLKEARKEMEYLTGDEEIKRLVELRERWDFDRMMDLKSAKDMGRKEGENIEKIIEYADLNESKIKKIQEETI